MESFALMVKSLAVRVVIIKAWMYWYMDTDNEPKDDLEGSVFQIFLKYASNISSKF